MRLGVTGHRFLADVAKLRAAVEEALDLLITAFPGRGLLLYSPLAEGADRLVARAVLNRPAAGLTVPLPLPPEDYAQDFASDESRREFGALLAQATEVVQLPPCASRNEAYEQVGRYVVDRVEALIAIWDGRGAQGRGGTAEVVTEALRLGRPVCHIWAGNYRPDEAKRADVGAKHDTVRLANFAGQIPGEWRNL